jgi:hypothetical protein
LDRKTGALATLKSCRFGFLLQDPLIEVFWEMLPRNLELGWRGSCGTTVRSDKDAIIQEWADLGFHSINLDPIL